MNLSRIPISILTTLDDTDEQLDTFTKHFLSVTNKKTPKISINDETTRPTNNKSKNQRTKEKRN